MEAERQVGGDCCLAASYAFSFTILWVWLIPIFNRSFKGSTPKLTRVQQIGGGALFAVISLASLSRDLFI